jgi:DNA-binding beta-propeller fold protein YncE
MRLRLLVLASWMAGCGSASKPAEPKPVLPGDGGAESVAFTVIHEQAGTQPSGLVFNGADPRVLWVVRYASLATLIITDPGTPSQSVQEIRDPAAGHFMNKAPGMAWGAGNTWATCGDNTNPSGKNNLFIGPTLFSGDLSVFGKQTPKSLGSHLDMLHASPLCRGITHQEANIFWVFNAYDSAIDKYDFHEDHGPGEDDHSDGEIYRYAAGKVLGKDGVPSGLAYSPEDATLYVADTGHGRIAKLDTKSGTLGGRLPRSNENLAGSGVVEGATFVDFVPPGVLEAPSGLVYRDGLLYATDNATSRFYVFDKNGGQVRTLDTGLPPGSLSSFTFGPDGKIWFVDMVASRIVRIDPK